MSYVPVTITYTTSFIMQVNDAIIVGQSLVSCSSDTNLKARHFNRNIFSHLLPTCCQLLNFTDMGLLLRWCLY